MAYFEHRSPAFWVPQRKPGPRHRIQYNPNAPFSRGLLSLLLFDGSALTAAGIEDKVVPTRKFSFNTGVNTTQKLTPMQRGGLGFSTSGSFSDQLNYVTALPSTANWTISALCTFDGLGISTYAGQLVLITDVAVANYVAIGVGNVFGTSADSFVTTVTSLLGPHRITVVSDGTVPSSVLYIDGLKSGSSGVFAVTFAPAVLFQGWPWPASDFFYWNRAMSASEVSDHAANPYTMLRPRGDIRLARRPPGPPPRIQIWDH